ncbi:MAG: tyrosine-type recombinase/integrase [Akkermansiaceae bacterium]|jgi:integrase
MAFLFKDSRSSYWQAGWKDENGKRINRSTKITAKGANRRQAQRIADEYEDASKRKRAARQVREVIASLHHDITGEDLPTKTVEQYAELFLARKKGESAIATLNRYQTDLRDFITFLGARKAEDINSIRSTDIAAYRNELHIRVAETTVSNKIKSIRAMFSAAHKEGLCMEEPTASLKLKRKGKAGGNRVEKRAFTLDELRLIRREAHGEWESMILFGLYTGQRLGDLATLRWSNIDLPHNEFRLNTRKTDRRIAIPLPEPLSDYLLTLPGADDPRAYIHPELAEAYEKQPSTLSNQFSKLLADCGLRDATNHQSKGIGRNQRREGNTLSFHCLRATAVTLLHDAGVPAATVEEWVGHDSAEVHRTYIKIGRETLERASKALPRI